MSIKRVLTVFGIHVVRILWCNDMNFKTCFCGAITNFVKIIFILHAPIPYFLGKAKTSICRVMKFKIFLKILMVDTFGCTPEGPI